MNADCIFGDRSASSMSKWRPAWTLTPEMIPFGTKSVTLSMLIDLLTSTMSCRSTQVKIASTDLWPRVMFTFSEMLALVESESSFGAYVCHRRPGGSTATSDLVLRLPVFKVARNEVENASLAQRSAHADSRIWRPELIEPAAERKRRAHGRRPTFKSAYPDPQILPQCNISSNYPL